MKNSASKFDLRLRTIQHALKEGVKLTARLFASSGSNASYRLAGECVFKLSCTTTMTSALLLHARLQP